MNACSSILPHHAPAARDSAALRQDSPPRPDANRSLNVVLVYDDFTAGGRAARALDQLKTESGPGVTLWPVAWSFDFLCDLRWRAQALGEIDRADVVILSINRPDKIPAAIDHWIETCLQWERLQSIPVLVMFDDDIGWTLSPPETAVTVSRPPAPGARLRSRIARRARGLAPWPLVPRALQPV